MNLTRTEYDCDLAQERARSGALCGRSLGQAAERLGPDSAQLGLGKGPAWSAGGRNRGPRHA